MTTVYALALEGGKYYIGRTRGDVGKRFIRHFNGTGSTWTKKNTVIGMPITIKNAPPYEETRLTLEYIDRYGIENVRGGIYAQLELTPEQLSILKREHQNENDICYRCDRPGHLAASCRKPRIKCASVIGDTHEVCSFHKQLLDKKLDGSLLCILDGIITLSCGRNVRQHTDVAGIRTYSFDDGGTIEAANMISILAPYAKLMECPTCAKKMRLCKAKTTPFLGCTTYRVRSRTGCRTKIRLP